MIKKIGAAVLAIVLIAGMASCRSKPSQEESKPVVATAVNGKSAYELAVESG